MPSPSNEFVVLLCVAATLGRAAAFNYYVCVPGSPGLKFPFCNSSLPVENRVKDFIGRLSLAQKCAQTNDKMGAVPELGFQGYNFNTECLHGLGAICLEVNGTTRCPSVFSAPPGLGATFNRSVAYSLGETISDEIRAYNNFGGHRSYQNRPIGVSAWGPNLNLYRDPRWGRNVEVPSEDPFHSGEYGVAYTKGLQWGPDPKYIKAIGALKHYTIYSVEAGRGSTYFEISPHDIEDSYLPQFRAPVVDAKSLGYMCSYAALTSPVLIPKSSSPSHPHSEPCCASKFFAQQKMVQEFGFEGYVQSDCGAVNNEVTREHYASSAADAAAKALTDGMMNSNCGGGLVDHICFAIAKGMATVADLEARVTRSLTLLMNAGVFDPPELQQYTKIPFETINSEAAQARSLSAARQSLVLLQNPSNILPLDKGKKIALIGPHAQTHVELAGNYFENIGLGTCAGEDCVPSMEASLNQVNGVNVTAVKACDSTKCDTADVGAATAAVKDTDYVVLAIGIDGTIEGEGHDRMDIRLPGQQLNLSLAVISEAKQHGKPVVVLLFNGGLVSIEELKEQDVAIVECFYPGATGGTSVAETVLGDQNRFGKLPFTLYAYNFTLASDFTNMNMTDGPGRTYKYLKNESYALWQFGFGLSYTTFSLSSVGASVGSTADCELFRGDCVLGGASVTVTNTGHRAGDEVVFLFHHPSASPAVAGRSEFGDDPQAKKQLVGFERVTLAPGQSQTVQFNVTARGLSFVDTMGTRHLLAGSHHISFSRGHGASLTHDVMLGGADLELSNLTPNDE
eukprot:m.69906 g.69906  ORF g.69906 m.69906 type:complete len:794 (+) comp14022_c0_seq3:229-2610(+)